MRTLHNLSTGEVTLNDMSRWPEIEARIKVHVPNNLPFQLLVLGSAKYDYAGAPSNWDPEHKHEETMVRWAKWCLRERKSAVRKIRKAYVRGDIPDAFDLMIDYFT